ncbi:MAG: ATP-binding cassette domain-containing protein [Lachnospiraceae bacterium]|nr:ATP-binding cassette domain-containing protein [Lachnospiraceae bacterium]
MICFKNVQKTYEGNESPLFRGLNLEVEEGEWILLTGRSGSGKSTIIRMILKEVEPDGGSILVNGRDISTIRPADIPFYRRQIGTVFQDFRLFEDYTVYENLELVYGMIGGRGKEAERKITNTLNMLGIDHLHRRRPKQLSGGEMQKVCLARALLGNPSIVLADEPTGNLDPTSSAEILKLMELIHRHGITVVMATHDLDNVRRLMHTGRRIDLDDIKEDI